MVAKATPASEPDAEQEVSHVETGIRHPNATTLRHAKELPARTDDVLKGITPPRPRKAVKSGDPVDEAGTAWRKMYTLNEP